MSDNEEPAADPEQQFEMTPEQATAFGAGAEAAPRFNRKKAMMILTLVLALFVGGSVLFNLGSAKKKSAKRTEAEAAAGRAPSEFLNSLLRTAASRKEDSPDESGAEGAEPDFSESIPADLPDGASSAAAIAGANPAPAAAARGTGQATAPPPQARPGPSAPAADGLRSSLVPRAIEGSLFSTGSAAPRAAQASGGTSGQDASSDYLRAAMARQDAATSALARNASAGTADPYLQQNAQADKQAFYDSGSGGGSLGSGRFLGQDSIWIGTVIPGILETAINTDLPGNVLARVTQNIYDSQTGRSLLIPQGTILVAKYNSSVSYAQRRVQIVWDTIIRPDGYQLELEGMNGVDKAGMSGQAAQYHENWFEYLKAAGIVTLFSIANSAMTETAAKYANNAAASGIASANSDVVSQLSGNMVSRAMNIQPTLTVENGTLINIMLNKNLYLPPVGGYAVTQKYILE